MKLTIISVDHIIHFFNAYTPQIGRPDAKKDTFWQLFHAKICNLPAHDYFVIADNLNDHVGEKVKTTGATEEKGFIIINGATTGIRSEQGLPILIFLS